jgi:hypothetical protein
MNGGSEVDGFLAQLGKRVAPFARDLNDALSAAGCDAYVKTIYIGYEIEGSMVAALYGHPDHIELALALDADNPCVMLKDASHLTWRTMPVAIEVHTEDDVSTAMELAGNACARVRSGTHTVHLDNEHFIRAREARKTKEVDS